MGRRGGRVAAAAACLLVLAAVPAKAAAPTGSQDVTPLVHTLLEGAPYVVQPQLAPVRDALTGLRKPRQIVIRGTVVTMDDAHHVIPDGNVLVTGDKVSAVWADSSPAPTYDTRRATVVNAGPDGLIFPGLINLHDHPTYDALPLWPPPSSHKQAAIGRPLGTEPYANRYQWNRAGVSSPPELARLVQNAQDVLVSSDALGLYVEVLKHAEARAVLGGTTAIQGEGTEPAVDGLLARSTDGNNFGRDRVDTRVPSVEDASFNAIVDDLRGRMLTDQVDAWLVHLGEGVRDGDRRVGDAFSSRHELDRIAELGVLNDATVVVHGVGLEAADFAAMRAAPAAGAGDGLGAKLVWSPLSNLLLYGRTAHVYDAIAAGVTVSLGTDWTPSGSNTLLGELKVADIALRDDRVLGTERVTVPALSDDVALDRALVDMVTRNPARTLHWSEVGTIAPGKTADLIVVHKPAASPTGGMPASPYRSLIDATERNVNLVLVGGEPVAGDVPLIKALRGRDYEVVISTAGGYTKAIDITRRGVPHGHQRLAHVEKRLVDALHWLGGEYSYLRKHFDGGRYLLVSNAAFRDQVLAPRYGTVGGQVNLAPMALHPLLAGDDHFFFAVIGGQPGVTPYPANLNLVTPGGNPFAPATFFGRWYATA
ncbi:MAG TPA: amidohydrolase family protein [Acidimicrobiales bacterium]|nr:amidohydrolase family protein [Acidimicrobiales bacterium]